jgi:hypothetical protein
MLPPFASLDDLEQRLGPAADAARAVAALEDASALIRAEAGQTWVTEGVLDEDTPAILAVVCLAVARRVIENPNGVASETLGDASVSYENASGDVYLTAGEKRLVRRAAGVSGAMGSIDLEIGTPGWSGEVIYVAGQDEPMPFTYEPLRP